MAALGDGLLESPSRSAVAAGRSGVPAMRLRPGRGIEARASDRRPVAGSAAELERRRRARLPAAEVDDVARLRR